MIILNNFKAVEAGDYPEISRWVCWGSLVFLMVKDKKDGFFRSRKEPMESEDGKKMHFLF